jgi:hypothetical protein
MTALETVTPELWVEFEEEVFLLLFGAGLIGFIHWLNPMRIPPNKTNDPILNLVERFTIGPF